MDFNKADEARHEQDVEVQLALNGDQEALGRVLGSYIPKLYRVALRVLGSHQDAEEALQDGFVQVVKNLRGFEGRSRFYSWVTRIIINTALMRLRQTRRQAVTSLEETTGRNGMPLAWTIADPGPNPEEIYARTERLKIVKRKLKALPAAYRSVLWLCDVQGLTTREAAEALGVPVGSVKSQLYRGRTCVQGRSLNHEPRRLETTLAEPLSLPAGSSPVPTVWLHARE